MATKFVYLEDSLIDTLRPSIHDYSIKPNNLITVVPASYVHGTGEILNERLLFTTNDGKEVYGSKAFVNLNDENIFIDVNKHNNNVISLHLSLPKVYNDGKNLEPVTKQQARNVLRRTNELLADVGIECNIEEAVPSRVDLFKNVVCDEPFPTYKPIFEALDIKRSREEEKVLHVTTFTAGNREKKYCIYDKIAEMKYNGKEVAGLPSNILRFENRLLNSRKVKNSLGTGTIRELLNVYNDLPDYYHQTWKDEVFKYNGKDVEILYAKSIEVALRYFRGTTKRNWLQRYLQTKGLQYLIATAGKEVFRIALSNVLNDETVHKRKMKIYRAMILMKQCEIDLTMIEKFKKKTVRSLYEELKEKVLFRKVA